VIEGQLFDGFKGAQNARSPREQLRKDVPVDAAARVRELIWGDRQVFADDGRIEAF
jgi:hypothetical protein